MISKNHILIVLAIIGLSVSVIYASSTISRWFSRVKECAKVVPTGTKLAYQKAKRKTKLAFLRVADKLEKLDPRLTGLAVAEKGAQAGLSIAQRSLDVAQTSLAIAQKGAQAVGEMSKLLAKATDKGFNVKRALFEAHINELKKPVVKLTLDALIAGRSIHVSNADFDLAKPARLAKDVVLLIAQQLMK